MNQLVFIQNDRVVTDSLTVADSFEKRHDNVTKDIKELNCSKEFSLLNFKESSYTNERGRQYTKFLITQDGFTLLAMGYTGSKAMQFKEKYIAEFNRMKNELEERQKPSYMIHDPIKRAEKWIAEYREKEKLEEQIEQQKPKVLFADTCLASDDSILVREVAKLATDEGLNIGQNRLFQKLRDWGYLIKGRTEPTQRAMDAGYFEVIQRTHQTPKGAKMSRTTKVTPKGQLRIIQRLKQEQSDSHGSPSVQTA